MTKHIQVDEFKASCLKLIDKVHRTKRKVIITKQNKPIAQLVPVEENSESLFGKMKGTIHIVGDIISSIDGDWSTSR